MYIKEIEKPNISLPSPRLAFSCLILISRFRNHHAERTNFARGSQCFDRNLVLIREKRQKCRIFNCAIRYVLQVCNIRHFLKTPWQALEPKPCFCAWWYILGIIVKLACLFTVST